MSTVTSPAEPAVGRGAFPKVPFRLPPSCFMSGRHSVRDSGARTRQDALLYRVMMTCWHRRGCRLNEEIECTRSRGDTSESLLDGPGSQWPCVHAPGLVIPNIAWELFGCTAERVALEPLPPSLPLEPLPPPSAL